MTDPESSPCETSTQGAPYLDERERSSHHLWISGSELKRLNTFQGRDLLASTLAHIWDDGALATTDVEKDIYDAT
jgi:hypothetical protein